MQQEWNVILQDPVLDWFNTLEQDDLLKIYAGLELLSTEGPQLGRPYADTLQGSKYSNLKELRVQSKLSVFRLFFILTPFGKRLSCAVAIRKAKKKKPFIKR